jgi:hypothetical protein
MDLFKDIIPGILENKRKTFEEPEAEKAYAPFMVNRALSYHSDCLYFANQLNQMHHLEKRPQIEFYLNTIRAKKRSFVKWAKPIKEGNLQAVKMYFGYSDRHATEALKILTDEQITFIKSRTTIGE